MLEYSYKFKNIKGKLKMDATEGKKTEGKKYNVYAETIKPGKHIKIKTLLLKTNDLLIGLRYSKLNFDGLEIVDNELNKIVYKKAIL